MREYRYELEKGSTKYECPSCGQKRMKRYIDNLTGEPAGENFGRCDRVDSCGYNVRPETSGEPTFRLRPIPLKIAKPVSFVDGDVAFNSLKKHDENNLFRFLCVVFGREKVLPVITAYLLGTSTYWIGSTVFWQIDQNQQIRTGKIMAYNATTGKRIRDPFNHVQWVHTVLKMADFNLKQCLFGEHLLTTEEKPVAIVESEKTALICAIVKPDFLWLATGGKSNFRAELFQPLKGRIVTLFPDLGSFDEWKTKSDQIKRITGIHFIINRSIEEIATAEEKADGLDIGDFILKEVLA